MLRTVYLAGPITQDPDYVQKFRTAAAVLRSDGFDVINPVEIDDPEHAAEALDDPYGERYEELLERDLQIIARPDVEAVVVLPGWEKSKGAVRETHHARNLGKPVLLYPNLNPLYPTPAVRTFQIKDSGERQEYASGMRRDVQTGKTNYLLLRDGPMFRRCAEHLTKGAEKYGPRNWTLADSEEELERFRTSACRHFEQWLAGDVDEDHAAAVVFNVNACEYVKERLEQDAPEKA